MTLDIDRKVSSNLVDFQKGIVSRDIFVDTELYEIEKERVFARCWLFVGFEDQVRKPGDYFVSRMGEESVILSRDRDNTVHVFLNSCRHRGMKVCRYDEGNTPVFTCPYHGWSYAGDGSLVGVPRYKDAYREELDKLQWGLVEVAQMQVFKGAVWATWDPNAPDFFEYVGDMKEQLDLFFNAPDGTEQELEVFRGIYKWTLPSNWKFGAENFLGDGYHGPTTHRSIDLLRLSPSGQQGRHTTDNVVAPYAWFDLSHHGSGRLGLRIALGDVPYHPTYPNNPVVEEYYRAAHERRKQVMGEQRARLSGGNGNIFPNATQGTYQTIAVWQPNGADSTEVWRWYFMHRDAPQEVKDLLRHYYMSYGGPAGLTEKDDMENWNYAHPASKGTIAKRYRYNYDQGLGRQQRGHPVLKEYGLPQNAWVTPKPVMRAASEQNARGAYKFWLDMMSSESWDDLRERGLWD